MTLLYKPSTTECETPETRTRGGNSLRRSTDSEESLNVFLQTEKHIPWPLIYQPYGTGWDDGNPIRKWIM